MRIFFTYFFLIATSNIINGQVLSPELDSLKRVILKSSKENKSDLLIQLARKSARTNPDSALFFLTQSIENAQSSETKGKAYFEKALLYRYLGKDTEQLGGLDTAYKLLTGINDSIAGDVLNYKEQLLANKGQYKEALQIGYKELAIRKKLSSRDAELNALLQIGYTYDRIGNYQKAINWYQKGLKMKGLKNEDYIGRNYGLIGIAYDELKDYEKAIFYNLQAISHFEKKPYSAFLHSWYSNIGNTYTKMGKLNLAEKYTLLALNDNKKKRYVTIINLGKIYIEKGNLSKAENVLKEVLADLQKKDQPAYLSEAYYRLHELFKKKNDFKTALFYYEKYKTTEDERLSIAKTKQFNELTVQYETVEKENTILQQKEKITENQLSLKSRNLWIFGLSLLAVIIGLIGFLLYKQQILKNIQQKNDNELKLAIEKIESQNRLQEQRLSISRDLHDNIGAQLSFIVSAIDTIKYYMTDKNNQTTNRLDNIAAFAKETIQELRDTIWAMNKSGITIKDLQSRIANFIEKAKQSHNNIQISLLIDSNVPVDKTFTGLQGLNIFRIIQEAISNALKYAESDQIDIHISKIVNDIHVIVKDNGKGFIENDLEAGNGLLNMRKRALELGDDLILISKKGIGTSISFNF